MAVRRTRTLRAELAQRGYVVQDDDVDAARRRLQDAPEVTDAQHAANLAWLAQFDSDAAAAA